MAHITAVIHFKSFGAERVGENQRERKISGHNERVKRNSYVLSRFIDCALFLAQSGKSGVSVRRDSEGTSWELLTLWAEHDALLRHHLDSASGFTENIKEQVISCVCEALHAHIAEEIKSTKFVSVMVDETDCHGVMLRSYVLRYVTDTGVKERFLQLEEVTNRETEYQAGRLLRLLDTFNCRSKLVAQSYDGGAVTESGRNLVQTFVKDAVPTAHFVHSYTHNINILITQGVSNIKECKIFFSALKGIFAFFTRSSKCSELLQKKHGLESLGRGLPEGPPEWNSKLLCSVHSCSAQLLRLFEHVLDHAAEFDWETIYCASGLLAQLKQFDFCFLLFTFINIFSFTDVLIEPNKKVYEQLPQTKITAFCQKIEKEQDNFSAIFERTVAVFGAPFTSHEQPDAQEHYSTLHRAVVRNIHTHISDRFKLHNRLQFLQLLDSNNFKKFQSVFPSEMLQCVTESYAKCFDIHKLKSELCVAYTMPNFQGKSVSKLKAYLEHYGLVDTMSELYALICLTMTVPVSVVPSTALTRIQAYLRNTNGTVSSSVASLCIEKELLVELRRQGSLIEDVIERFFRKNPHMDFVYKSHQSECQMSPSSPAKRPCIETNTLCLIPSTPSTVSIPSTILVLTGVNPTLNQGVNLGLNMGLNKEEASVVPPARKKKLKPKPPATAENTQFNLRRLTSPTDPGPRMVHETDIQPKVELSEMSVEASYVLKETMPSPESNPLDPSTETKPKEEPKEEPENIVLGVKVEEETSRGEDSQHSLREEGLNQD